MRVLAPLLCLIAATHLAAQNPTAAQLFAKGMKAENAGRMAEAYLLYSQAAAKDPNNLTYWERSQVVRSRASLEIDPKTLPTPDKPEGESPKLLHFDSVTARDLAEARKPLPPTELAAEAGVKDFNLRANAQVLFETVAKAFGLNCVFDGDYQAGNPVHFEITGADYRTALDAVELATGSFLVPVTPKLFLVAKDSPQKRTELEPTVSVQIHLPEPTNPQDFTAAITAVQQSMALEKVSWDTQTNTVVMRDRISKVVPARAMLEELMRRRPQVVLETDIIEVDRHDLLNWGLSLPNLFPINAFSSMGSAITTLQELSRWGPGGVVYAIAIENASLLAQLTKSSTHSLTHLDLRSVDGQAASFHSGERYPVLTSGYFGPGTTPSSTTPANPTNGTSTGSSNGNNLQNPNTFGDVSNPSSVVVGDFNRDGILDFASAAAGSNSVALFLGKGNGTFEDPVTYATGQNPSAILAANLRGNGILDLVTADADSNDIGVLLGNGDGTFQPYTSIGVGSKPAALAATDFNGDGFIDLAVANSGSDNMSILLGRGDGTFQEPSTVQTGTSPRGVVNADFNGDGIEDLAVVNYTSNDLWILLGNGNGTFTNKATYTGLNAPRGITAASLNLNKTTIDLVVANSGANTVSVFSGDGTGNFPTSQQFATGSGPVAVVTANFQVTAILDIATANYADGTISVLLGNGDGTFQSPIQVSIGAGTGPVSLATGSFNNSGYAGLLVANFLANSFSVLLGSGNGGFINPSGGIYPSTGGTYYAPPPAFNYEDLGLVIKATPHVHGTNEVGLELEAEIKLLTGSYTNGIPQIAQRKLASQVELRTGECAIVAGLMSDQQARSFLGIPGLSTLPGFGSLLRTNTNEKTDNQVLIIIKPVLIDLPPDQFVTRPVWVGSETRPLTPL